jgi:hypothetical protein
VAGRLMRRGVGRGRRTRRAPHAATSSHRRMTRERARGRVGCEQSGRRHHRWHLVSCEHGGCTSLFGLPTAQVEQKYGSLSKMRADRPDSSRRIAVSVRRPVPVNTSCPVSSGLPTSPSSTTFGGRDDLGVLGRQGR